MKTIYLSLILIVSSYNILAQTQSEMNQTSYEEYEKVDKELNVVYKQVMKKLDKTQQQLLIKAQKDWLKFRVSHCDFEASDYEGGSMQPLIRNTCFTECTTERIEYLKSLINKEY